MTGPEQHPRLAFPGSQALSNPHIPTGPNDRSDWGLYRVIRDRPSGATGRDMPRLGRLDHPARPSTLLSLATAEPPRRTGDPIPWGKSRYRRDGEPTPSPPAHLAGRGLLRGT